jgi:hypothetical protein
MTRPESFSKTWKPIAKFYNGKAHKLTVYQSEVSAHLKRNKLSHFIEIKGTVHYKLVLPKRTVNQGPCFIVL